MAPLDSNFNQIDPSTVSVFPLGIRYGLLGGLLMIVYALVGIVTGLNKPSAGFVPMMLNGLLSIALYIGIIVYAIKKHRDEELGGFISFGRAMLMGLIVAIVAGILGAIFNYVYMNFIDPEFMATMIVEMEEMFDSMGLSEDQIEEAMVDIRANMDPSKMFVQGLTYSAIGGAIISSIVAAIMKRNPE